MYEFETEQLENFQFDLGEYHTISLCNILLKQSITGKEIIFQIVCYLPNTRAKILSTFFV
jgi:hypothetical protein